MEEVINVGMNRINKTPAAVKVTANGSLKGNKKSKHASESVARFIFLICAVVAILAVCSITCLLYTSPSPRDVEESRMPSSA